MDTVAQVSEPSRRAFGIEFFDAGVVVGRGDDGAGDGGPVLRRGVLEGELGSFLIGEV